MTLQGPSIDDISVVLETCYHFQSNDIVNYTFHLRKIISDTKHDFMQYFGAFICSFIKHCY